MLCVMRFIFNDILYFIFNEIKDTDTDVFKKTILIFLSLSNLSS